MILRCLHSASILLVLLILVPIARSIPLDNGVIGLPQVDCQENQVSLIFNTEKPFTGRIFVKGMVDNSACAKSFTTSATTSAVFDVQGGGCNMRRTRVVDTDSRGVEQSMTVIISFHSTFITKVDRAYRCTCFFMEADKVVTNRFDVSMLATTDLVDTASMPACTYVVKRGSVTGPIVSYATVGEEVYHVWDCNSDMYGMLVHSCFVDDGSGGQKFELLDINGCSIDPTIMTDLTYNQQTNMAYVEAHVSKFPDKSSTYFQCAVSICMKADGSCDAKTPPQCRSRIQPRGRRAAIAVGNRAEERSHQASSFVGGSGAESDFDLVAEPIVVLDIDDRNNQQQQASQAMLGGDPLRWLSGVRDVDAVARRRQLSVRDATVPSRVCLSAGGFGLLLAVCVLILTASATALALLYVRQRRHAAPHDGKP